MVFPSKCHYICVISDFGPELDPLSLKKILNISHYLNISFCQICNASV